MNKKILSSQKQKTKKRQPSVKEVVAKIAGYFAYGSKTRKSYANKLKQKIQKISKAALISLADAANLLKKHFNLAHKKHERDKKTFDSILNSVSIWIRSVLHFYQNREALVYFKKFYMNL